MVITEGSVRDGMGWRSSATMEYGIQESIHGKIHQLIRQGIHEWCYGLTNGRDVQTGKRKLRAKHGVVFHRREPQRHG